MAPSTGGLARAGPARPSQQPGTRKHPAESDSVARASSGGLARAGPVRPSQQLGTRKHPAELGSVARASSGGLARAGPVRPSQQLGTRKHPAEPGSVARASSLEDPSFIVVSLSGTMPQIAEAATSSALLPRGPSDAARGKIVGYQRSRGLVFTSCPPHPLPPGAVLPRTCAQ